jgi:Thymidine phosphorylase
MKFKIKGEDYILGRRTVFMNENDAFMLGLKENSRVLVDFGSDKSIFFVSLSKSSVESGNVIISLDYEGKINNETVDITPAPPLKSLQSIKKKIYNKKLGQDDFDEIIKDIVNDNLSQIEISSYITSLQTLGLDEEELHICKFMVSQR